MPDYIMLMKLTSAGASHIDESPDRISAATKMWARLGGTIKSFHGTFGEYDFVAVGEAPNDWVPAAFASALASSGFVTTTTMKAFSADDMAYYLNAGPEDIAAGTTVPKVPNVTKHNFGATFFGPPLVEERSSQD